MAKLIVNLNKLRNINVFEGIVEKARKGEQVGGDYIYRETIAEKVTTDKDGHKRTRRYNYYYIKDMLKDSAENILEKINRYFFKGDKKAVKEIEKSYDSLSIQKDFNATKKDFYQHIVEYFSHRSKWDKIFLSKLNRDKVKKPIKMEVAKEVEIKDMDIPKPESDQKELFTDIEKKKPLWKPNPSLIRRIWEQYSGKTIIQSEKEAEKLSEKIEKLNEKTSKDITKINNDFNDDIEKLNRHNAMLDNQNAKKDGIISEGEKENEDNIKQTGISERDSNLRRTGSTDSVEDVYSTETETNGNDDLFNADELGRRSVLSETDYEPTGTDNNGTGRLTKKQASEIRTACENLLASKTDEQMTEEDKKLLSQYVGAGGNDKVENRSNSGILYEFYTPRNIVSKVWDLIDKYLPNRNKTCIEPSSGIGRFAEGRNEKFTMFEFEETSARIAKILHPDAEVVQGAFETNFMEQYKGRFSKGINDSQKFDCAVGNPPYGAFSGKYKGQGEGKGKGIKTYVEYFIDRTLDTLKDNGVMAMVVPHGFLNDKQNRKIKERIAEKGKLLEAWRMPSGAFNSENTQVATDIIVIRKEPGNVEDFMNGKYFADNPSHVLGEIVKDWRGNDTVVPRSGKTADEEIESLDVNDVEAIIKELPKVDVEVKEEPEKRTEIPDNLKFGDTIKTDNGTGKIAGFIMDKETKKPKAYNVVVKGEVKTVYVTKTSKEHGNKIAMLGNQNAAGEHFTPSIGKVMTAEEFNAKYGKSFVTEEIPMWKATDYKGNIDVTKLTEDQKKYMENSKDYIKENGTYTHIVNYKSGNIRQKLKDLESMYKSNGITQEQYEYRKALLDSVLPETKELQQIKLSPVSDWVQKYRTKDGMDLITGFFVWAYNGNQWFSPSNSPITPEEIPPEISFDDIKEYILEIPCKKERSESERMKFRRQTKRRETAEKLFNRYLQEALPIDDQEELKNRWNDIYNTHVNPDYEQIPVLIDGMSSHKGTKEFTLTEQQLKGISLLTNKGAGLLAYDVGLGKTACGIVATVNQILTGRAKRPLVCVPKSVYKNWILTIHQLFPNVKVNELGNLGKDYYDPNFVPEDGSISVCTYTALEHIGFTPEEEEKLSEDAEFATYMESGSKPKSERKLAQEKQDVEEFVGGLTKVKGNEVKFSDMGFDHITVDEVHNFRNLFTVSRKISLPSDDKDGIVRGNANEFSGLGGGKPSEQSKKLFAITQLIQRANDDRNVFLLSATPFQNSPVEIYSILSYMARDRLKELGIYSLEQFIKNFAKLSSEMVVKANKVDEKQVMTEFNNLSALQNLITEFIDKVDGEEGGVPRPYKITHTPELEMTDEQREIMDACNAYIDEQEAIPKDDRDPGYMFRAMNTMRMATLSPALVDRGMFETLDMSDRADKILKQNVVECSPKLKFVCDSIVGQYKQNSHNGQVIYMPSGIEKFNEVKEYLIKKGVPADAIGMMKGSAANDRELDKRQELMNEFNSVDGKVKVLIGSGTIKEGVNLNGNSTVIYNCQLGWNPTDDVQVEGRIWRQGNKQGKTHIVYPLMNDTIDAMLMQKHYEKGSRLDALFSYKGDSLNVQDITPEELRWGLIKDPAKRADLQVRQYTEENENNEKLYAQLIDVLRKQEKTAFGKSPEEIVKEKHMVNYLKDKEQGIVTSKERIAEAQKIIKDLKKTWKGKEDEFTHDYYKQNEESLGYKYYTLRWGVNTGRKGFEEEIKDMENRIENEKSYIESNKRMISKYNKEVSDLTKSRDAVRNYLAKKGIKTQEDLNDKVHEYVAAMSEAKENQKKAKEMREEFYRQAVLYNEKNKKKLLPLDEMVKQNVDDIMNDLVPFEEVKDKIMSDLEKKYNKKLVKKSMIVIDGRIYLPRAMFR